MNTVTSPSSAVVRLQPSKTATRPCAAQARHQRVLAANEVRRIRGQHPAMAVANRLAARGRAGGVQQELRATPGSGRRPWTASRSRPPGRSSTRSYEFQRNRDRACATTRARTVARPDAEDRGAQRRRPTSTGSHFARGTSRAGVLATTSRLPSRTAHTSKADRRRRPTRGRLQWQTARSNPSTSAALTA